MIGCLHLTSTWLYGKIANSSLKTFQHRCGAVNATVHSRFVAQAVIVKAMAHPSRLFIVDELSRKERCVCELRDMIGADMSTVSKHLSVLRHAGIVMDEKRGNQIFYKLRSPCVLDFFSCVEGVLKTARKQQ